MKSSKLSQAHMLLDAMNEIDDRYLAEALSFSNAAQSRHRPALRVPVIRVLSGAAALAALLSLVIFGTSRGFLKFNGKQNPSEAVGELIPSAQALDGLLQECTESVSFTALSADALPLFDGTVRLAIKSTDSDALFVSRPLNAAEQAQLTLEFEQTGVPMTESETADADWAVWITLGNGQVVTPCLTPSSGNVGMGELFGYASERLPTKTFLNLLNTLK